MRDFVTFSLNGKVVRAQGEEVLMPLANWLRVHRGLSGTKIVCAEGDCGACSVLMAAPKEDYYAINSCIMPVAAADGKKLITVEGLSLDGQCNEIQEKMVTHFGSQCGFCTPGFVTTLTAVVASCQSVDERAIKNGLTGNLCRCTGYSTIITAALASDPLKVRKSLEQYDASSIDKDLEQFSQEPVLIRTENLLFHRATKVDQAIEFLRENKSVKVLGAATDLGVQYNKEKFEWSSVLSLHGITEFSELFEKDHEVHVGASVSLSRLRDFLKHRVPEFSKFLDIFASPQIKNVATLAGNVVNASPIADTVPFLLVVEAKIEVRSPRGSRLIAITDFFRGYKQLDLKSDELVSQIIFRIPKADEVLRLYKVSQRRDLDISTVNAAFLLKADNGKISDIKIAYGGVGPTAYRLRNVEASLLGKAPNEAAVMAAIEVLQGEIRPISDVRGSEDYRRKVSGNLFRKFWLEAGGAS